jgi:hypothetical protein
VSGCWGLQRRPLTAAFLRVAFLQSGQSWGKGLDVEDLAASGRSFPAVVFILTLLHTGLEGLRDCPTRLLLLRPIRERE